MLVCHACASLLSYSALFWLCLRMCDTFWHPQRCCASGACALASHAFFGEWLLGAFVTSFVACCEPSLLLRSEAAPPLPCPSTDVGVGGFSGNSCGPAGHLGRIPKANALGGGAHVLEPCREANYKKRTLRGTFWDALRELCSWRELRLWCPCRPFQPSSVLPLQELDVSLLAALRVLSLG